MGAQIISFTEIAALVGAVEIATTVFKQRAPGMSLNRVPLYVWALVVTSFMVLFAMPAVMLASSMLATDRMTHVSTHFFHPAEGGDAILWQPLSSPPSRGGPSSATRRWFCRSSPSAS